MIHGRFYPIADHIKVIPDRFHPIGDHLKAIAGHFYPTAGHLKVIEDGKKVIAAEKVISAGFS